MRSPKVLGTILPIVAFGVLAINARADTFDFSYSFTCYLCGPFVGGAPANLTTNASGVLITTNTEVNGALTITGITGSRTTNWWMSTFFNPPQTATITGLIPAYPPNPEFLPIEPDNLLYPNSKSYLDQNGFAYQLNCYDCGSNGFGGTVQIAGDQVFGYAELGVTSLNQNATFTLTQIPEPTYSLAFLSIAGLAMLLYSLNRSALRK